MNIRNYRKLFKYEESVDPQTGKTKRKTIYVGDYYTLGLDEQGRKKLSRNMAIMWFPAVAAFIAGGMMNTSSSHCLWVSPFYMLQVVPLVYWLVGWLSCLKMPEKLTELQKRENILSLKNSGLGLGVLGGLAIIGDCILGFTQGWLQGPGPEALFMALCLISATCGFWLYATIHRLKIEVVK
ncbi:MAG: hypothetical protein IJ461_00150 [Clostridia bacterium]|nr:hypothetical protein [Clostridia bacterium]